MIKWILNEKYPFWCYKRLIILRGEILMYSEFGISKEIIEISNEVEKELEPIFEKYEENC